MNNTICPHPWTHSYIGSHYERKLCCLSLDIDEYKKTTTKEFWNSSFMKSVRLNMIKGEQIKECSACYAIENSKIISLRQILNNHYKDRIEKLLEDTKEDGSIDLLPEYFDYRTITCNLQCISCGDIYSSKQFSLNKKIDPNYNRNAPNIDKEFEKNMADEMIQAVREKRLKNIYWAGGEPMLSYVHWAVIDEMNLLYKDPEYKEYVSKIFMHYNTNYTQLYKNGQSIPKMLEKFQPSMQPSLDGTHETIEYTRDGCKWSVIENNWKEYHKYLNKNRQLGIASILSGPVILDIDRWFDFYEPYDPFLHNHKYLCEPDHYPKLSQGLLDVRLFPKHIFDRVVGHAIERFEKTDLRNAIASISILKSYIVERSEKLHIFDNEELLIRVKHNAMFRDKYLISKRPLEEILKIIDKEAYEWYKNIPITED